MNVGSHVDSETLDMLKDVMEDGFDALLNSYLDDGKVRIASLRSALSQKDSDSVRQTAHSLKGSSGNLGATQMAALCLTVEQCGKDGQLDGLDDLLDQIEDEFSVVSDIMSGYLH